MKCPLCNSHKNSTFFQTGSKSYYRCVECLLVFLDDRFWMGPEDEKGVYDHHKNSPLDLGYRKFLSRLYEPLLEKLTTGDTGLDFGSGSGPTLSVMFAEAGYNVDLYDKFYANDLKVFEKKYNFITSTEVFEHLCHPRMELERLLTMLTSNGFLGIMTKLATDKNAFSGWHYKNDPTHICFYSQETFKWIAKTYQLSVEFIGKDVIILKSA